MPFGCRNATAVIQRIVDNVLNDANLDHCACAYVDDIIIHSNSTQNHIRDVKAVLAAFAAVGLRVHPA
jgi:hypothetical protein